MPDGTDDLTIDRSVEEVGGDEPSVDPDLTDLGTDAVGDTEATVREEGADTDAGLRDRASGVFSPVAFAIQVAGALVGTFVIGGAVPLGPLSGVVGVLAALFALGTLTTEPRYVEAGTAGALAGLVTTVLTTITLSVVSGGLLPVAGGVVGAAAGLVGHYLGRDLRDGLTRDL